MSTIERIEDIDSLARAKKIKEWIVELRRDFHMYPEPSLEEVRTSNIIAEKLKEMNIEVTRIGKTGVLGLLKGKGPGNVIALRADIDALSVQEKTGLPYSSKNEGFMHACGHDTHIAMLLGAAKILSEIRDDLNGTVKFIFQPAEEMVCGAVQMINGGVLENPKVDMAVGIHTMGMLECGEIVVQEGAVMAASDGWKLNVIGRSCHGSSPWQGNDAIACGIAIVNGFQAIVTKFNDARNPIVINVGTIQGGERTNVVAGNIELAGANRSFDEYSRTMMPKWMENVIKNTCEIYGCTYKFEYKYSCDVTVNDKDVTEFVRKSVKKIVGETNVHGAEKSMGSEDFSAYAKKVPAMMMNIGGGNKEKGYCYSQHSNYFMIDEDCLPIGTASYVQVAIDYLK